MTPRPAAPTYAELTRIARALVDEVIGELAANDADEIAGNPMLRGKDRLIDRVLPRLEAAEASIRRVKAHGPRTKAQAAAFLRAAARELESRDPFSKKKTATDD